MNRKAILDGRNILIPDEVALNNFEYFDVGRSLYKSSAFPTSQNA
jgi:hypothetical protein